MRGCFQDYSQKDHLDHVLPAYAGMFLTMATATGNKGCSPRVCGDVSVAMLNEGLRESFSPRMRGCFPQFLFDSYIRLVLPAYAGMFLSQQTPKSLRVSSPRVCGDVSKLFSIKRSTLKFSPRMRGCFSREWAARCVVEVLPAYAGMFLGKWTTFGLS